MLKTWLCSAPLLKVMESAESGGNLPGIVDVPLKDSEERMWVKQDGRDRITAIFSVNFVDDDDAVFARVFFNEFNKSISGTALFRFVSFGLTERLPCCLFHCHPTWRVVWNYEPSSWQGCRLHHCWCES